MPQTQIRKGQMYKHNNHYYSVIGPAQEREGTPIGPMKWSVKVRHPNRALSAQKHLPMAHLIKRAMHDYWQQALHEANVEYRSNLHGELVSLRLRPALAERVRGAVNRNRSAMVERCCLLYVDAYLVKSPPGKSDDGRQQQTDGNPNCLTASTQP